MSESTFELFEVPPEQTGPREIPISAEDIARIRRAFDDAGIVAMNDRQALLESCTIRPVANIRELLARDVRPILKRIEQKRRPAAAQSGSAWDNRDEATWIDRL